MSEDSKKNTKQEQSKLPEGITNEDIKAMKSIHGEKSIYLSDLYDDEGNFLISVIIRKPRKQELSDFEKWVDRNPLKAKEITVNSCLLSHKETVKANEMMFLSAFDAIAKLFPVGKSVVKNL